MEGLGGDAVGGVMMTRRMTGIAAPPSELVMPASDRGSFLCSHPRIV
jgi:hypothetical protein